jgi:23S rRNA (uracil1939-C5)-methyltransferase
MQLTIEKLVYGGDGLARLPADASGKGKAAFVPFVLTNEEITATLIEQRPGFARGRLDSVLRGSPQRVEPPCPHFAACGGCHYQHANYEEQLRIKVEILRENLRRLAKFELETEVVVHASPPWGYRNRTRLALRQDGGFKLGYRRFNSDEVLAVEECPIVSPLLQRAMQALWKIGRAGQIPIPLREVEFFADAEDQKLTAVFHQAQGGRAGGSDFPKPFIALLQAELPGLESIGLTEERVPSRKYPNSEPVAPNILAGHGTLTYNVGQLAYQVSAGAFFQSNRHLIPELIRIVTVGQKGETALDLYAGAGLFSLPLAANFQRIVAVESSPLSFPDLRRNLPPHAKAVRSTAEAYLQEAGKKLRPELIVVDPPRTGLGSSVARSLAQSGSPRITYVSCDPATLARDLTRLVEGGYHVTEAHLIDLFPQTYHLETIVKLTHGQARAGSLDC